MITETLRSCGGSYAAAARLMLMAGVPQIAADLPQRTSRQLWAMSRHHAPFSPPSKLVTLSWRCQRDVPLVSTRPAKSRNCSISFFSFEGRRHPKSLTCEFRGAGKL
jgi:hypothetical protein